MHQGVLTYSGNLEYQDKNLGIKLHSTTITSVHIGPDGNRATFSGAATVNGTAGYTFTVNVEDHGEPGGQIDKFRIIIAGPAGFTDDSNTYASQGGLLDRGGNIQIHPSGASQTAPAAAGTGHVIVDTAPAGGTEKALYVYGTAGDDTIVVSAGSKKNSLQVSLNGKTVGTYTGIQQVYLYGGDGDDTPANSPKRVSPSRLSERRTSPPSNVCGTCI